MKFTRLLTLIMLLLGNQVFGQKAVEVDVCVYGGVSAGVMAAYSAKKLGKSVILIEPGKHLGGMSAGGLGSTDIGNKFAITGLSRDFYRRIGQHYNMFEKWTFEPHVAEALFNEYVNRAKVNVLYTHRIVNTKKEGTQIREIVLENSLTPEKSPKVTIKAKMFIDCSYEGDLMAKAGVSYTVGREANSQYNETLNGVQLQHLHQFPDSISPYVVPGDPYSGVVWGVSPIPVAPNGTADQKVQAYNFRTCLTSDPKKMIPLYKPDNYDPKKYVLLARLIEKGKWKKIDNYLIINKMPNNKTDINHKGGFSTDFIGKNWDYPEADYNKRAQIWKEHEDYTKGLFYFLANDPSLPEETRESMRKYGYPKDEYKDNNGFSFQLYVREARRMVGEYVMTEHNCTGKETVNDAVGMAAYTMDSHNCQRVIVNGFVKNEGNVEVGGFPPYPITYRAIVPKKSECTNLLVPVCMSATHIAYGSIRMEPVFMVLAQSAAVAAVQAIDSKTAVQQVDVAKVQAKLANDPLLDGSIAEILVDDSQKTQVETTGNWESRGDAKNKYNATFLYAPPADKNVKTVTFHANVKKKGTYTVYYFCTSSLRPKDKSIVPPFATNVPVQIKHAKGISTQTMTLNNGDNSEEALGWIKLGDYEMKPGDKNYLQISTEGANGGVVADAVLFVPVASSKVSTTKK